MISATALTNYVFPLLSDNKDNIASNKYLIVLVTLNIENIIICSLITSRISNGSILFST